MEKCGTFGGLFGGIVEYVGMEEMRLRIRLVSSAMRFNSPDTLVRRTSTDSKSLFTSCISPPISVRGEGIGVVFLKGSIEPAINTASPSWV